MKLRNTRAEGWIIRGFQIFAILLLILVYHLAGSCEDAHAFTAIRTTFTAPYDSAGLSHYRPILHTSDGQMILKTCWSDSTCQVERQPAVSGQPDTCWIGFSDALPTSGALTISGVDFAGNIGALSNALLIESHFRADTLMGWISASNQVYWARTYPYALQRLRVGEAPYAFLSQSAIQWRLRYQLLAIFGYYVIGGQFYFVP